MDIPRSQGRSPSKCTVRKCEPVREVKPGASGNLVAGHECWGRRKCRKRVRDENSNAGELRLRGEPTASHDVTSSPPRPRNSPRRLTPRLRRPPPSPRVNAGAIALPPPGPPLSPATSRLHPLSFPYPIPKPISWNLTLSTSYICRYL